MNVVNLETDIKSPGFGISITVPTNCQLGDVVCTKHLPGLICHVAVGHLVGDGQCSECPPCVPPISGTGRFDTSWTLKINMSL